MKIRPSIIYLVLFLTVTSVILGLLSSKYLYPENKILYGIYIGSAYVGGMTYDEAVSAINSVKPDELILSPFSLVFEDESNVVIYEFKPSLIGASPMTEESVADAMKISNKEGYFERAYTKIRKLKKEIQPRFTVKDDSLLKDLVTQLSEQINCKSEDARFKIISMRSKNGNTQKIIIREDKKGREVLINDTVDAAKKLMEEGKTKLRISVRTMPANVTSSMLRNIPSPDVIGTYTTYYGTHDSPNRIHNIYLVSSFVDNKYIASGEVFSLLSYIGDFSGAKGFKEAYVIMGDELVPEYGGGTCQIATTLYNSVMMADLDVLSRTNHGMYFSIYPLGRDATVYPPSPNFRFRNNTGYPIVVYALPFKKGLTFRIIGHPTGKKVSFSPAEVRYKYTTITTTDAESGLPVKKVVRSSAFGTTVIKTVKLNGKVIKSQEIRSFYKLHGDKQKVKIRRREPR